jgi:hypothetical protein
MRSAVTAAYFLLLAFTNSFGFIKVFYLPTEAQYSCFKRILKFTLKHFLHVSVQCRLQETIPSHFHSCTAHLDTIKVFYLPTDAQYSCFKRILKFTLKQLLHVSVQSPSSGSILFELAKVIVVKIII